MTSQTFFFFFIPTLAILLLAVNFSFASHNPYPQKNGVFECGFSSFIDQNRSPFPAVFFIVALLFTILDGEVLLVYPYTVSHYNNGVFGLLILLLFMLVLTLGFAFELGKNALSLESKQNLSPTAEGSTASPFSQGKGLSLANGSYIPKNTFSTSAVNLQVRKFSSHSLVQSFQMRSPFSSLALGKGGRAEVTKSFLCLPLRSFSSGSSNQEDKKVSFFIASKSWLEGFGLLFFILCFSVLCLYIVENNQCEYRFLPFITSFSSLLLLCFVILNTESSSSSFLAVLTYCLRNKMRCIGSLLTFKLVISFFIAILTLGIEVLEESDVSASLLRIYAILSCLFPTLYTMHVANHSYKYYRDFLVSRKGGGVVSEGTLPFPVYPSPTFPSTTLTMETRTKFSILTMKYNVYGLVILPAGVYFADSYCVPFLSKVYNDIMGSLSVSLEGCISCIKYILLYYSLPSLRSFERERFIDTIGSRKGRFLPWRLASPPLALSPSSDLPYKSSLFPVKTTGRMLPPLSIQTSTTSSEILREAMPTFRKISSMAKPGFIWYNEAKIMAESYGLSVQDYIKLKEVVRSLSDSTLKELHDTMQSWTRGYRDNLFSVYNRLTEKERYSFLLNGIATVISPRETSSSAWADSKSTYRRLCCLNSRTVSTSSENLGIVCYANAWANVVKGFSEVAEVYSNNTSFTSMANYGRAEVGVGGTTSSKATYFPVYHAAVATTTGIPLEGGGDYNGENFPPITYWAGDSPGEEDTRRTHWSTDTTNRWSDRQGPEGSVYFSNGYAYYNWTPWNGGDYTYIAADGSHRHGWAPAPGSSSQGGAEHGRVIPYPSSQRDGRETDRTPNSHLPHSLGYDPYYEERPDSCIDYSSTDVELWNHQASCNYCKLGVAWISQNIAEQNADVQLATVIKQLIRRNVTCRTLFSMFPLQGEFVQVPKDPLYLSVPNYDNSVYLLARKVARIISYSLHTRPTPLSITNNGFLRLLNWEWKVPVSEVLDVLDEKEARLFMDCITTNYSLYPTLQPWKQAPLDKDADIASHLIGFSVPNVINKCGLAKYISVGENKWEKKQPKSFLLPLANQYTTHPEHKCTIQEWFCPEADDRLAQISRDKNIPLRKLKSKLFFAGVKCKYLLMKIKLPNGLLVTGEPLQIIPSNVNQEVSLLAHRLVSLTSRVTQSRHYSLVFSNKKFSTMTYPSSTVVFSDISNDLSPEEVSLLIACVKANPLCYQHITIINNVMTPCSVLLSARLGYSYINLINKHGFYISISS